MKKKILINLFSILFLIILLSYLSTSVQNIDKLNQKKADIRKCADLSFQESKKIKHNYFGSFDIELKILEQRKWKKTLIKNVVSQKQNRSFTNKINNVDADLVIKTKSGLKCTIKAKIMPHGDLGDHYTGKDRRFIYELPSIKVNLLDGHIFGIVKFRLFKPATREHGNEIFATTLLQELNMLAPRTSFVSVQYNNNKYDFIFQEKIVKEFLEYNNLLEGPIYSGDERFVFKFREAALFHKESGISKHKLADGNWANLSLNNNEVASEALEILNLANYFYTSDINQMAYVDYYTSQLNSTYLNFFKELPKFDSLLSAIGAEHNLSRDDRRFYYDLLNRIFLPIYYDGMLLIFDENNSLINDNKRFNMELVDWINLYGNNKVTKSAIHGSTEAINAINNLDLQSFHKNLINRGLSLPYNQLIKVVNIIKQNLLKISKFPLSQTIKVSNEIQYPIKNAYAYKKNINARYIFNNKELNNFKICDLMLAKCNNKSFDLKTKTKALEQKLIDKDGFYLIYQGQIENLKRDHKVSNDLLNKYKTIKINSDTELNIYGDLNIEVNKKLKKINIKKINIHDKAVFKGGMLDGWNINFADFSMVNEGLRKRDKNGLSGCLNFYDLKIKNLHLLIDGAVCEDAANFVRSKGNISYIKISNSLFDAIDLDFSKIILNEVIIEDAGNDCIDLSFGNYNINTANLKKCGDKAISVGEDSNVIAKNIYINKSKYGIASKDYSVLKVLKGEIIDTEICMAAYSKKQEFSGSVILAGSVKCKETEQLYYEEDGSKIRLNINL